MHVMPEGIDYGVIDDTAARGNGSFSRSTRALELEHRLLKFDRRFVNARGRSQSSQALSPALAERGLGLLKNPFFWHFSAIASPVLCLGCLPRGSPFRGSADVF